MVSVKLFGTFRLDSGIKSLELEASSVKKLLPMIMEKVKEKDPDTELTLDDLKGCIISLNGKQVGFSAKLKDGDKLDLVPAVAGG